MASVGERAGYRVMAANRFVKSATTKTPVPNSRNELERMLTRYGCSSFSTQSDYETGRIVVGFVVPDSREEGAVRIPVRLEINSREVCRALYGPLKAGQGWTEHGIAQAERVAWRQLVLWVDAALSAAAAGVQKISEAFFAHTLVRDSEGRVSRMVDHLDQATGGSWKALLPPASGGGR